MITKLFFAASLLLGGISMPSTVNAVTPSINIESSIISQEKIDSKIERILVEEYAAPHWNLSNEEAWYHYHMGNMIITEIIPGVEYIISFDGGELEILFEGH